MRLRLPALSLPSPGRLAFWRRRARPPVEDDAPDTDRRRPPLVMLVALVLVALVSGVIAWALVTADEAALGRLSGPVVIASLADPEQVRRTGGTAPAAPTGPRHSVLLPVPAPGETVTAAAPPTERAEAGIPDPAPTTDTGSTTDTAPATGTEPQDPAAPPEPEVVLAPAPDPDLIETSDYGPIPVIASDGRTPWETYRRPFPADEKRPRLALVITGLGLNSAMTERVLETLPGPVTLAFSPYAPDVAAQIDEARARGHEVLLMLPLEPDDFPENDPGPYTLLTQLPTAANLDRLDWIMARAPGYVGLIGHEGARYTLDAGAVETLMTSLARRGLLYVDNRPSSASRAARVATRTNVPRAIRDATIDIRPTAEAIDQQMAQLVRLAKASGAAVGFAQPLPLTLERLETWLPRLRQEDIALAPISAVVDRQSDR